MRSCGRRNVRAGFATLALILSGCAAGDGAGADELPTDGPLWDLGAAGTSGQLVHIVPEVKKGQYLTDGMFILRNRSEDPIRILDVESVGADGTIEQVDVRFAGEERKRGMTSLTVSDQPPEGDSSEFGPLIGADEVEIEQYVEGAGPKNDIEMLVVYRVLDRSEYAVRREVRIRYEAGGREYLRVTPVLLALCPDEWPKRECDQRFESEFPEP